MGRPKVCYTDGKRSDKGGWPNNRVQAKMRLQGLKKRFMKDGNFLKDYSNFMEDLFQKGYTEMSSDASGGNKWYIPYHGVYHPAKPEKIRVLFDCNVEYLGYALTKQLIAGSDLTNQIISVPTKFRQEQAAFMGDTKALFYQVRTPEYQQHMLRFLWWQGNNFNNQPTDHQVCVHVFGGASSSSCCNCAL